MVLKPTFEQLNDDLLKVLIVIEQLSVLPLSISEAVIEPLPAAFKNIVASWETTVGLIKSWTTTVAAAESLFP